MRIDVRSPDLQVSNSHSLGGRFLPLVAVGAVAIVVLVAFSLGHFTLESLFESRAPLKALIADRPVQALVGFGVLYLAIVALSIPGASLLTLLGGFLFGPFAGGTVALFAATAGGVCVFLLARRSLGELFGRRLEGRVASLMQGIRRDALSYILFARLTPVFPFWLVNLVAGASRVPLKTFAWATFVGIVPMTLAVSFAGAALDEVAARQMEAFAACRAAELPGCRLDFSASSILTPHILSAGFVLGLLALLPVALRALRVHPRL